MNDDAPKKKILAVDDDPMVLSVICKTFTNLGFDVLQATDGQEALSAIKNDPGVSLVILDQMMPKMDGIKACALIKADRRYQHIPVVMVTASADESDKKLSQDVGADAHFNKPLNIESLIEKVRGLLKF